MTGPQPAQLASCAHAQKKAEAKLADVRAKLADLHRMEEALAGLVKLCGALKGRVRCPLIAALKKAPAAWGGQARTCNFGGHLKRCPLSNGQSGHSGQRGRDAVAALKGDEEVEQLGHAHKILVAGVPQRALHGQPVSRRVASDGFDAL